MAIDGNTNVAKLLDEHPELLDAFVKVSPHFKKLENRFLRKTIARRVKISDAAKVGGVDLDHLIQTLNAEVGNDSSRTNMDSDDVVDWSDEYEEEFDHDDSQIQVTLDVREDIASNLDLLSKIMRAAKDVQKEKMLVVVNSFEPVPLYEVLGRKGFVHKTESHDGYFRVFFKRTKSANESAKDERSNDAAGFVIGGDEKVMEIDVRSLEPPEPMMKILKAINTIGENTILLVHHHREPLFLYDKLEERGFAAVTNKVEENHYKIVIQRKKPV